MDVEVSQSQRNSPTAQITKQRWAVGRGTARPFAPLCNPRFQVLLLIPNRIRNWSRKCWTSVAQVRGIGPLEILTIRGSWALD